MATFTATSPKQLEKIFKKIIPSSRQMTLRFNRMLFNQMVEVKQEIINDHHWNDRTGKLTASHEVIQAGDLKVRLVNTAEYAKFIRYGTKAHMVRPKRAKALSFFVGGKRVFSKGHMVSGIKGRDWLGEAYRRKLGDIKEALIKVAKREFG